MCKGQINIMARTCICFVFFVIIFPRIDSEICILRTESGEYKRVCCADYEAKHNDCIACPKGYTSYTGQNCRPCPENTYGERCRYDCICTVFEVCIINKGCVRTTHGISLNESSQYSTNTMVKQETPIDIHEHLSTEIITYYTLSLTGMVFGIWLFYLFYKYKKVTKKTSATLINSKKRALRQHSQHIEMEESLHDIIDDTDMPDDQNIQQLEIVCDYVDVVSELESISTKSIESNSLINIEFPRQILSSANEKGNESKEY